MPVGERLSTYDPEVELVLEEAMGALWGITLVDEPELRDRVTRSVMSILIAEVMGDLRGCSGDEEEPADEKNVWVYLAGECDANPDIDMVRVEFYVGARDFGDKFIEGINRRVETIGCEVEVNNEV